MCKYLSTALFHHLPHLKCISGEGGQLFFHPCTLLGHMNVSRSVLFHCFRFFFPLKGMETDETSCHHYFPFLEKSVHTTAALVIKIKPFVSCPPPLQDYQLCGNCSQQGPRANPELLS